MGIFRNDPMEKFVNDRSKKLQKILYDDGCKHTGKIVMWARPSDASAIMFDNLRHIIARYYLETKGTIYLRDEGSFDEFESVIVSNWGYGFNGEHEDKIFFSSDSYPWIFIIQEQEQGIAEEWFLEHYKNKKVTMKSIIPLETKHTSL